MTGPAAVAIVLSERERGRVGSAGAPPQDRAGGCDACRDCASGQFQKLDVLMVVSGHAFLRDVLIFNRRPEHHAVGQLIDHRALDFLPGRLACGIFEACRFRKLDSRVSMMEPAKDRVCDNISEPLDRACVGRILPERNMSSYAIIIGDVFR